MTARTTLADLIETAIDSVHDMDVTHRDYAEAAADAVLANVPGLVWVQGNDGPRFEYSECGSYQIYYTGNMAETILSFGVRRVQVGRFAGDALGEKSREAAEADHRARLAASLGLTDGGEG